MTVKEISYNQTNQFSDIINAYLQKDPFFEPFINEFPSYDALHRLADRRNFESEKRTALVEALTAQYENAGIGVPPNVQKLSSDSTFTVTTGHQLNILTGPLYGIIKIACVIRLTQLANEHGKKHFVPVFWMATEDHDLDEIDHLTLFNKQIRWETDQTGAVGAMSTGGMQKVLETVSEILGDRFDSSLLDQIRSAYTQSDLATAHRHLIHTIFGKHDLVILDGNDVALKSVFADHVARELKEGVVKKMVDEQNTKLAERFPAQAFVRDINLFYLEKGKRERIEKTDNSFRTADGDVTWTEQELMEDVRSNPERFSPNVLFRPVYQETILPNLAYIGGGGEIAYWFQLKKTFDAFGVEFPLLILRNSFGIIREKELDKWHDLGFTFEELFQDPDVLKRRFAESTDDHFELTDEKNTLNGVFDELIRKVVAIDKTLEQSTEAERNKLIKSLENLENKVVRAVKRNYETEMKKISSVTDKVLPGGALMERRDNFLQYYTPELFNFLLRHSDPIGKPVFQMIVY